MASSKSKTGAGAGRMVARPSRPTSVQGQFIAGNGTYIGGTGRGRPARANYVAPRGRRG